MTTLTDSAFGARFAEILRAVETIDGSNQKLKRFARAASIDELGDLYAELTFAMLFFALGFKVQFEPTGEKGPDLLVNRDHESAYVEVKRFRPRPVTNALATIPSTVSPLFQPYGQPEKDTDKVRAELYGKFRQVIGHNGILAIWSDDDDLESLEHQFAVNDMRRDDELGFQHVPQTVLFSVFAGNWLSARGQQVYCSHFRSLNEPFRQWAEDLEFASVTNCVRHAIAKLAKRR